MKKNNNKNEIFSISAFEFLLPAILILSILFSLKISNAAIFRNLAIGSRGEDVKEVQLKLGVMPTGYFGSLTKEAVRKWQASQNIPSTGFFGILTRGNWNRIFSNTQNTNQQKNPLFSLTRVCSDGSVVPISQYCVEKEIGIKVFADIAKNTVTILNNDTSTNTNTNININTDTNINNSIIDPSKQFKICWNNTLVLGNEQCPDQYKTCPDGTVLEITKICSSFNTNTDSSIDPKPSLGYKSCPDGSVVFSTSPCPPIRTDLNLDYKTLPEAPQLSIYGEEDVHLNKVTVAFDWYNRDNVEYYMVNNGKETFKIIQDKNLAKTTYYITTDFGTTITLKVKACNPLGCSAESSISRTTQSYNYKLNTPNIKIERLTSTDFSARWEAITSPSGYAVRYKCELVDPNDKNNYQYGVYHYDMPWCFSIPDLPLKPSTTYNLSAFAYSVDSFGKETGELSKTATMKIITPANNDPQPSLGYKVCPNGTVVFSASPCLTDLNSN